jgi:hypothetical protein
VLVSEESETMEERSRVFVLEPTMKFSVALVLLTFRVACRGFWLLYFFMVSFALLTRRLLSCLPMARFACDLPVSTTIECSLHARAFEGAG